MKATTIVLTDAQVERLEEAKHRSGLPVQVLIGHALDTFLGIPNRSASNDAIADAAPRTEDGPRPGAPALDQDLTPANDRQDLWFVGIGQSEYTDTSERMEELVAEEWGDWLLCGEDPPFRRRADAVADAAGDVRDVERSDQR